MGQFQHGAAKFLKGVTRLVIQADLDKYQQTPLQMLRVQPRVVTHDDPFALQAAYPLGARRGRQPDLFSQLRERNSPVGLQDAQDIAVDLVQLPLGLGVGTHRGYASVKRVFAENCRQI